MKSENEKGKVHYIVDDRVLRYAPELLKKLTDEGNDVYIPWATHKKLSQSRIRYKKYSPVQKALAAIRVLSKERCPKLHFLRPDWNKLRELDLINDFDRNNLDDLIVASAFTVFVKNHKKGKVVLLSHDDAVAIKAESVCFHEEECLKIEKWTRRRDECVDEFVIQRIEVSSIDISKKHYKKKISIAKVPGAKNIPENAGAFLIPIAKSGNKGKKRLVIREGKYLKYVPKDVSILGQVPKDAKINGRRLYNYDQGLAIRQLKSQQACYSTLMGPAGTGKTYLAITGGIDAVLDPDNHIDKMYITRAAISQGKTIGFMPGSLEEKMSGWIGGMMDNIHNLMDARPDLRKTIDIMLNGEKKKKKEDGKGDSKKGAGKKNGNGKGSGNGNNKKKLTFAEGEKEGDDRVVAFDGDKKLRRIRKQCIFILSPEQLRGRDLRNAYIVYDETQNNTIEEVVTATTRLGKHSKMVLTGDVTQRDNEENSEESNGLIEFSRLMRGREECSAVLLPHTVRSRGARAVIEEYEKQKNME